MRKQGSAELPLLEGPSEPRTLCCDFTHTGYNDFAQLTQSYQAHSGAVNTGTTPQVQFSYADGLANTIRITGMTNPDGRNVVDDYGAAGNMNDVPCGT